MTTAERPVDLSRCLHELFVEQAARSPDAVAVSGAGSSLTYAELDRRSNALAASLRRRGIGPETPVALCVERTPEVVVGVLGILKAGGAYVPIDPTYPRERQQFILQDSGAHVIVADRSCGGPALSGNREVVYLDGLPETGAMAAEAVPMTPANLAYIIYTSGSTGWPKGTLVEHRNVTRLLEVTRSWLGQGPRDVWTLFHSIAFDFSVWEMWGALAFGGRVVVVTYDESRSPTVFRALLAREGVTILNQTPSAFRALMDADAEAPTDDLALRFVLIGGEAYRAASLAPWWDRHGEERPRLVNIYGPTETTCIVTHHRLDRGEIGRPCLIGRGFSDVRTNVLDAEGRETTSGEVGELVIGGPCVVRGYLNRPELDADRFVPDPFAPAAGARMYRTGDLVRRHADGTLEFVGRADQQVKIRGFRVELGEIEAALGEHPEVQSAAVTATNGAGDPRLVAYVVATTGFAPRAAALREFLGRRLPDYMLPAAFVPLERLPLTANGKVDRAALPAPSPDHLAAAAFEAPIGELEEALAGIFAAVLELEGVSRSSDFFELGGHSILAIQAVNRIRKAIAPALSLRALFDAPTVASLAAVVMQQRTMAQQPALAPRPVARAAARRRGPPGAAGD
ncbi:MAG: amino acid adenylation domain-containing protein, partial [Gemmatimonadales bacterium]